MSIKNKLRLGIGFLFLLALISSGLADYYLTKLSNDSKAILKDNYRSLTYANTILKALETENSQAKQQLIESNILNEEQNITEPGEKQLADSLYANFEKYKVSLRNPALNAQSSAKMRSLLYSIMQLNMNAIKKRGDVADGTAHTAIVIVSLIGSVFFLVAFSFMINFPGYVANPVIKNISEAKQLSEAKTTFIATISHELKTPLSAIKMSLKLLDNPKIGSLNEEQQQLLDNIGQDTQRLLQITAELLDTAQVEAGKIKLNFGSTHPINIVNYAVQAVRSLADQKRINIVINCPENLTAVSADLDKSTWVLINILSNAIKYSPSGSVIQLDVEKCSAKAISFSVKDNGPGIDEKYLSRIFERYFRVPGAEADQTGTGLGLAIAKDFIEAQGGAIGVESEPGSGSRFYFFLSTSNNA